MTLVKWDESVRLAKIRLGIKPDTFVKVQGKLLKEAQKIYHLLLLSD